MTKVKQQAENDIHTIEQCFFEYLTGKHDENWAIAYIADAKIRGQKLRSIFNKVYDGIQRTDQREERARGIRQRLDQNGF